MKKGILISSACLILVSAVALSCSDRFGNIGCNVTFHVKALPDGLTKTEYSGEKDSNNKERINWSAGDQIYVYSPQAVTPDGNHGVSYGITDIKTVDGSDAVSRADITVAEGNGLSWSGSGEHDFYAVYPSPSINQNVSFDDGAFSGVIPSSQTVTQKSGTKSWAPDMSYAYMLAKTTGVLPGSGSVSLSFVPVFTAFSFTIGPGENTSVDVSSFTIQSQSQVIAGSVEINTPQTTCSITGTDSQITVSFSPALVVDTDVTFTVLALPRESFTDMSITFTGTQLGTRTLQLTDPAGNYINFPGRLKYHIFGLSFPYLEDVSLADRINWELSVEAGPILWGTDIITDLVDWDNTVLFNPYGGDRTEWAPNGNKEDLDWEHFIYINGEPFVWGTTGFFYDSVDWDSGILASGNIGDYTQWGSNGNKEDLDWEHFIYINGEQLIWETAGFFYDLVDWDSGILASGNDYTQWGTNGNKENLDWDHSIPNELESIIWK